MFDINSHARDIAGPLSESLAALEIRSTPIGADAARRAIHGVWLQVVEDLENGRANLSGAYLAAVHERLSALAGLQDAGGFTDESVQMLPNGRPETWSRFMKECHYDDASGGLEEEYALAQLRWGGHVRTFAMSLGWIAMNIVRLRREQDAVYPPPVDHEQLLGYLDSAGPPDFDAEAGLRGIADDYAEMDSREGGERGASLH
jgi:hypothetical protein